MKVDGLNEAVNKVDEFKQEVTAMNRQNKLKFLLDAGDRLLEAGYYTKEQYAEHIVKLCNANGFHPEEIVK